MNRYFLIILISVVAIAADAGGFDYKSFRESKKKIPELIQQGKYSEAAAMAAEAELYARNELFYMKDVHYIDLDVAEGNWSTAYNNMLRVYEQWKKTAYKARVDSVRRLRDIPNSRQTAFGLDSLLGPENVYTRRAYLHLAAALVDKIYDNPDINEKYHRLIDYLCKRYGSSHPVPVIARMILYNKMCTTSRQMANGSLFLHPSDVDRWLEDYERSGLGHNYTCMLSADRQYQYSFIITHLEVYYYDNHKYARAVALWENEYNEPDSIYGKSRRKRRAAVAKELGGIFLKIGDHDLAEKWLVEAERQRLKLQDTDSIPPLNLKYRTQLASLRGHGMDGDAQAVLDKASRAMADYKPASAYFYAEADFMRNLDGVMNLADYYVRKDDADGFRTCYEHPVWYFADSLQRASDKHGANAEFYRRWLQMVNMSAEMALRHGGDLDSVASYLEAIHGDQDFFMVDADYYQKVGQNLAQTYIATGRGDRCSALLTDIWKRQKSELLGELLDLSAEYRAQYFRSNAALMQDIIPRSAAVFPADTAIARIAYDNALLCKGLMLNVEQSIYERLAGVDPVKANSLYSGLRKLKAMFVESTDAEEHKTLPAKIHEIEAEISRMAMSAGINTMRLDISPADVSRALKPDEAAIEFMKAVGDSFVALVLRAGDRSPRIVPLTISGIDIPDAISSGRAYDMVWAPLEPYLQGVGTVYFSPDGVLYSMPVEYASAGPDGSVMADRFDMRRLSSTREIVGGSRGESSRTAAVFGGLDYNAEPAGALANDGSDLYAVRTRSAVRKRFGEGFHFGLLPATAAEAEDVALSLGDMGYDARLFTGADGTEAAFRALSGSSPGIVHIATHGFYHTEDSAAVVDGYDRLLPQMLSKEMRAMSRSGIVLAGANSLFNPGAAPTGWDNDGIMTAFDIAGLDFSNTSLVVLSACQTGLGDISVEGVAGLQRGFKKAGARSVLMSLWPVDDIATYRLMEKFYSALASGKNRHQALAEAREHLRADARHSDFRYWGAFVLLD